MLKYSVDLMKKFQTWKQNIESRHLKEEIKSKLLLTTKKWLRSTCRNGIRRYKKILYSVHWC